MILFIGGESINIHRRLHNIANQTLSLLKKAAPEQCKTEAWIIFEEKVKYCQTCFKMEVKPFFWGYNIKGNSLKQEMTMNWTWIEPQTHRPTKYFVYKFNYSRKSKTLSGTFLFSTWFLCILISKTYQQLNIVSYFGTLEPKSVS